MLLIYIHRSTFKVAFKNALLKCNNCQNSSEKGRKIVKFVKLQLAHSMFSCSTSKYTQVSEAKWWREHYNDSIVIHDLVLK